MKRLLPFAPLLLLGALLLSPAAALAGAKRGLDIWWGSVFPALLPSFICVRLSQSLGMLQLGRGRPRAQLAAVMGFSLVSGAPNGAKLLHALVSEGVLSSREGDRLLPLANQVGPAYLLSIIASELLKNKALFMPMAAAFYGVALILIIPRMLRKCDAPTTCRSEGIVSFSEAFSAAVGAGMLDMLRIGGCILFVSTLLSLAQPMVPREDAFAALAGCMEVSVGASAIARLDLSLRLRTSLLIGFAAFGGLSLALQTLCCYPALKVGSYLIKKLLLGALVGLVCYLLFPLFPAVSPAFASRQEVLSRSLSLSALILSSALSAAFIGILSLMVGPLKKNCRK